MQSVGKHIIYYMALCWFCSQRDCLLHLVWFSVRWSSELLDLLQLHRSRSAMGFILFIQQQHILYAHSSMSVYLMAV